MADKRAGRTSAGQIFALLLAGAGVGWLAGLSVSPVATTLLAALMSAVGGVVAGFASAGSDSSRERVDAWPAAALVLGVALGSPTGILARTHSVFGAELVGAPSEAPSTSASGPQSARTPAALAALYSVAADDCARLLGSPDRALIGALETSRLPWGPRLAKRVPDPLVLREVVKCLCEP
jgi:hypothetical protein